jgi:hypothetical protein
MNQKVCQTCRRYAGSPTSFSICGWMCASHISIVPSRVIPGFKVVERYDLTQMGESMLPPVWCERPLEHAVTEPGEDVDIRKDSLLVSFDGNRVAETHCEWKTKHR